jgi:hypothetical protein
VTRPSRVDPMQTVMGFWSRVTRQGPLSRAGAGMRIAVIALGLVAFCATVRSAHRDNLLEYTFGKDELAVDKIRPVLLADFGVTIALGDYAIRLGGMLWLRRNLFCGS